MEVPHLTRVQWRYLEALRLKPMDRFWTEPEIGLISRELACLKEGKVALSELGLQILNARKLRRNERLDTMRQRPRVRRVKTE